MRLVVPLIQKLLVPWIIPKKEFVKFGINSDDIIHYKAIDASIIAKRKVSKNSKRLDKERGRRVILVRVEEEYASYSTKKRPAIPIIKEIIKNFSNQEIIVMGRYTSQVRHLDQTFGKKIRVFNKIVDSKILLENVVGIDADTLGYRSKFVYRDKYYTDLGVSPTESEIRGVELIFYILRGESVYSYSTYAAVDQYQLDIWD